MGRAQVGGWGVEGGGLKVSKPDKVHSCQNTAFCRAYAKVQNIPGKEWPSFL